VIEGPWVEPRIYPDIAGILNNPDAAYAKLWELGQGLFGGSANSTPHDPSRQQDGNPLNDIMKQLFGR
jgi:AsmA protein